MPAIYTARIDPQPLQPLNSVPRATRSSNSLVPPFHELAESLNLLVAFALNILLFQHINVCGLVLTPSM